jgi:hypothetical protein
MAASIMQGIVIGLGAGTLQSTGTCYDHVEIAQIGGSLQRLRDVLVPEHLEHDIVPGAIGEFHCRAAEPGGSPANEIVDFRRADRPAA